MSSVVDENSFSTALEPDRPIRRRKQSKQTRKFDSKKKPKAEYTRLNKFLAYLFFGICGGLVLYHFPFKKNYIYLKESMQLKLKNDTQIEHLALSISEILELKHLALEPNQESFMRYLASTADSVHARLDHINSFFREFDDYTSTKSSKAFSFLEAWKMVNFRLSYKSLKRNAESLRDEVNNFQRFWIKGVSERSDIVSNLDERDLFMLFTNRLNSAQKMLISSIDLINVFNELQSIVVGKYENFDYASALSGGLIMFEDGTSKFCHSDIGNEIRRIISEKATWTGSTPFDYGNILKFLLQENRPNAYDLTHLCSISAIEPGTLPNQCWLFTNFPGKLYIAFPVPVFISAFTIQHSNFSLSAYGSISSAPRTLTIYGVYDGYDNTDEIVRHTFSAAEASSQTIKLKAPTEKAYHMVLLQISSNYGTLKPDASPTCLYRFRVHGEALLRA